MRIQRYEPWMREQIAKLFKVEYGITGDQFEKFMSRLYEHKFQQNRHIRVVALDNQKVIGFQTFVYWPYCFNGAAFHSLQSCNSIVHPDYRGKGLFTEILDYCDKAELKRETDFLIGFPARASYASFLRNGWKNVFNLEWYVKVANPIGFAFRRTGALDVLIGKHCATVSGASALIQLLEEEDFRTWKAQLVDTPGSYFQYAYSKGNECVIFDLKIQKRGRVFYELIIGSIRFDDRSLYFIDEAFDGLIATIKNCRWISIISIAVNDSLKKPNLESLLRRHSFRKLFKQIRLIVKPLKNVPVILEAGNWSVGRADIDTW